MTASTGGNDKPTPPLHPLDRYKMRHSGRPANQTPDQDLLLLSLAEDTHAMRLLAEANQEYINTVMDMHKA